MQLNVSNMLLIQNNYLPFAQDFHANIFTTKFFTTA